MSLGVLFQHFGKRRTARRLLSVALAGALFVFVGLGSVEAQIAPGVLQSAAKTSIVTGSVVSADGTPVSGAEISLIGPSVLKTAADQHGTFAFIAVTNGTYLIVVEARGLGRVERSNVVINGDTAVAIQYSGKAGALKTIAQVSTRDAGIQINATAASISSVAPTQFAFEGNTSWQHLVDQVPGVTVGGNLNGGQTSAVVIPEGPFVPVVLSINGALPYETSVTLDGMPLNNVSYGGAPGSGYDLYALPLAAFESADVVRGPGANAPSIVDSIGGSFVLHAPSPVAKSVVELSTSNDPYGGIISTTGLSFRSGRLSLTGVYGVNDSPGPFGNYSFIPADTPVPTTINGKAFAGCGQPPSGCFSEVPYQGDKYQGNNVQFHNPLFVCCARDSTAWSRYNDSAGLSYRFGDAVTAQVFYAGSSGAMDAPDWQAPANFAPGAGYSGSLSPGYHMFICCHLGLNSRESSSLVEEKVTATFPSAVLRVAAVQNTSFLDLSDNSLMADGAYQLWGTGYYKSSPTTPIDFNGLREQVTFPKDSLTLRQWSNSRDYLASYAGQLANNVTLGLSYVTSYYNVPQEESYVFQSYDFSGSSYRPTSVSSTTDEVRAFTSLSVSDRFSVDASWYFAGAAYHVQNPADSSGNTFTDSIFNYNAPRVGLTWRANQNLVIRAAAGGGYALPPLGYLVGTNGAPFCTTSCTQTDVNLNLRPEESFGFDLGSDIRFNRTTGLSIDLYRSNLYGQFFQSTALTGTYRGLPLYTTQYQNLAQSRYEGINTEARHDVPKGMYWDAALGLTRGYVVSVPKGFYNSSYGVNTVNTYIVPNINFTGQYQSTVPYASGNAEIGYRWRPDRFVAVATTYYGNNNAYFYPAFAAFDLKGGYAITKNIALRADFQNISGIHGQNYQSLLPSTGAPVVSGLPFALIGIPYQPRSLIVTVDLKS